MATFTNNSQTQLADIKGFEPDFGFLAKVYGTKQAEYDRGFSMVKNLYNSMLNDELTNDNNQKFRQDAFKKLEHSLRSASGADLSQASNIMKAQSLIEPIASDRDFAYDRSVTAYHRAQKNKMNAIKNSSDPKVRATYSDIAAQYIAQGEEDLRNAKRGDGSIQQIKPREFVQFEDVIEHLNTAAKDAKLDVIVEKADGKGYIIKQKNGDIAEKNFQLWAQNQLSSPKFQRQFAITGEVQAENMIRSEMSKGLSRQDAVNSVAATIQPQILEETGVQGGAIDEELNQIETKIDFYKKQYATDGFPADKPEIIEDYKRLLAERDERKSELSNLTDESGKLQDNGVAHIASNLYGYVAKTAMLNEATNWGRAKAYSNVEYEMEPDTKVIHDMDRAQKERHFNATMDYNMKKDAANFELKKADYLLKEKIAKGKGELASEDYLGNYVSTEKYTGAEILQKDFSQNRTKMFNGTFGTNGGLINLFVPEDKQGAYYSSISKLRNISNGSNAKLSEQDVAILKQYAKKVGANFEIPKNKAHADAILNRLISKTYTTASNQLAMYSKTGTTSTVSKEHIQSFANVIGSMRVLANERTEINKNYSRIANVVKGQPELFEGAKVISWMPGGIPVYDLSNVSKEGQTYLNNVVSSEYNSKTRPVGSSYQFSKMSSAEIAAVFSPNFGKAFDQSGEEIDISQLQNLNVGDAQKLFGNTMVTSYDPVKEKMIVNLKVTPGTTLAKNFGVSKAQTISIEIPYNSVKGNPALTRYTSYLKDNEVDPRTLGRFKTFVTDPTSRVVADTYMKHSGFNFDATMTEDHTGRPGLNVNYKIFNPITNTYKNSNVFIPTNGTKDIASMRKAENQIEDYFTTYMKTRGDYESGSRTSKTIAFFE